MGLYEQIEQDLKQAMRAQDARRTSTLRLLKSAMKNAAIEKRQETLPDADVVAVVNRQIKQRREAIEAYGRGGRLDLVSQEEAELTLLTKYVPPPMDDAALQQLVEHAVTATGASTPADQGKVMKQLMAHLQGQVDGKRVSQLVAIRLKTPV